MRQLLKRIFDGLRGGTPAHLPLAVLVVIERSAPERAMITMGDVDFLSRHLGAVVERSGVGNFEDCEFGPDAVRLHFFATDAKALAAALVAEMRQFGWCRGAVIRTTGSPSPEAWHEQVV